MRTGDRRAGWRPEEEGGQMRGAGLSRGLSRAGSRSGGLRQAGDDGGRGGRESRSGRRLGNSVVVLPPRWLQEMLILYNKSIVIKKYPSNLQGIRSTVVPRKFVHSVNGTPRISGHGFSGTQPRESNGKKSKKRPKNKETNVLQRLRTYFLMTRRAHRRVRTRYRTF